MRPKVNLLMPHTLVTIVLVFFFLYSASSNAQKLRIAVPDYPPYTFIERGQLKGEGYDALIAIMAKLQIELRVVPVPNFSRALLYMQNNLIDGLYLATETEARNALAVYSVPVYVTDWSWVWLKSRADLQPGSSDFKQEAHVTARMNSSIYRWLLRQGYLVSAGSPHLHGLFNLLNHHRVDAIMLPEQKASQIMAEKALVMSDYNIQHEVELEFGFYISRSYIAAWPDTIPALNTAIREYQAGGKLKSANRADIAKP
jgi:hypothetical protein